MTIKRGEPIDLCYGVALWDGHVEPAGVQAVYARWVQGTEP
jgi:hypothetical protein